MNLKYKWKDEFLQTEWYQKNPAETYLSPETKRNMMLLFINNLPDDLDSEAEIILAQDET